MERIFRKKYAEKHFCERKFPNQGTYMGFVIAHRPEQCGTQPQNERAAASGPSKRGGGGPPPRLFASGLSPRESLDPRPGPGGKPPCRCEPAAVLTEPPVRGGTGLRTLWVGGAEATLRRSAPLPRLPGGGSPFLPRNGEKEGRGFAPGPRGLMAARCHSLDFGIVVFGTFEGLLPPVS